MAAIVEQLRAQGLHPSPLPLGAAAARLRASATPATRSRASSTRRATPTSAASGRRSRTPNVTLWTNALRAPADHRRVGHAGRGGRGRARRRRSRRSTAPLVIVSCGAVNSAALLLRSATDTASERPGQFVRPGRPALHGAPRDDDAGVPSVPDERHGVPEDRGDQRLLPARAATRVIRSGQIQSQGRTHGVMAQTVGAAWMPLWAYDAWVARGVDWLAMSEDLPRLENRVTVEPDGQHPAALPAEQPRRARAAGRRSEAHPARARLLDRDDALAQGARTRRISAARWCSAPIRATSVLDPFCRTHDVDNLFVVDASFFPVVGRGQSRPDDRGAGAPRRRSHSQANRPIGQSANPPAVDRTGVEERRRRHDAVRA